VKDVRETSPIQFDVHVLTDILRQATCHVVTLSLQLITIKRSYSYLLVMRKTQLNSY